MLLKLVQVNLNHTAAAQDLLLQAMAEEKWDLAIISEPYRVPEHPHWAGDTEGLAAVVWAGSENSPPIQVLERDRGYVMVKWGSTVIASCYASPNKSTEAFERYLDGLELAVRRNMGPPTIVAGDLNAKARAWGSGITDARGELFLDWMANLGLSVMNQGQASTCVRWQGESVVDVTLATPAACRRIAGWHVDEDWFTYSDHRYVRFELGLPGSRERPELRVVSRKNRGWAVRHIDEDMLRRQCRLVGGQRMP